MPQRLHLGCLPLSIAAAFGAGDALALGFARAQPSVTLGAPLEFAVGVRLDPSEVLLAECVSADVWVGDAPVPRGSVGASLVSVGGVPTIVVRTLAKIDEPVVTVNVTAGCEAKVSRRFTLFADPPGLSTGLPAVVDPEPVSSAAERTAAPTALPPSPPAPSVRTATAREPTAARRSASSARPQSSRQSVASAPDSAIPATREVPTTSFDHSGPGARLRLDAPSVTVIADRALAAAAEERLAALQALRLASDAAQAASGSAAARVSAMEASLETLKRESQANRETMARLQQRLADADERGQWTPWLLAAVLGMLGIAGWLYARLRRVEAERQKEWWSSSQVSAATGTPGAAVEGDAAVTQVADQPAVTPVPPSIPTESGSLTVRSDIVASADRVPASQATQPLPAGLLVPDTAQRDVSIEELLDVEQQAEFFVVLGQDEAAVDLLMGHLRSAGGASPLPYLKLLEIYHRRGDQAAYERMRRRFNDRFNAVAPDWTAGLQRGRSLEDYPEVIARIQRHWNRPADAMAELETLLFRTDAGELFDLPAYRDVLFLFTLARDLQEMAPQDGSQVDVLLPLPPSAEFADTGAAAYLGARPGHAAETELRLKDPTRSVALSPGTIDFDSFEAEPPRRTN